MLPSLIPALGRLGDLVSFFSPVWPLFCSQPVWHTIYNILASSSLGEFTSNITIMQGFAYCYVEACCFSTIEALLLLLQSLYLLTLLSFNLANKKRDIRQNGSRSQSMKGGRPESSENSSVPSRRCALSTCPNLSTTIASSTSTTPLSLVSEHSKRFLRPKRGK